MSEYTVLIGILLAIFAAWYLAPRTVPVFVNAQTPRSWNMVGGFDNTADAAALLASVHADMITFMRALKHKYHIDEPDDTHTGAAQGGAANTSDSAQRAHMRIRNSALARMADYLLDNYNPDVFYENRPNGGAETSYTINKGAAMYICLRDARDPTKLVDRDLLKFVLLHEMAHIANYSGWGHDEQFWTVFKWLLHEAQSAGVYTPVDYARTPQDYCGLLVYYQPLFDKKLRSLWLE